MNIDNAIRAAFDHYNRGDFAQAEALCRKVLAKKPKSVDTLSLLGMIYYALKQYDAAVAHIRKALQYDATNVYLYNNLGTVYKAAGNVDEAIAAYQKALQFNPRHADTYNNLGTALQSKKRLDEAVSHYEKALQLNPRYADAYFNLGTAFRAKGMADEAAACYQKAVQLNPEFTEAYNNLGADFKERGQLQEALNCFQKVLQLHPGFVEAYNNIGNTLSEQGKLADAESYYRRALQMKPDFAACYSNVLLLMNYTLRYDAQAVYQEHCAFAKQFAEPLLNDIPQHTNVRTPHRRLKIGYVSPDFRRHSVNYFIEPVLASHDRDQYEVFCYSDVLSPDEVTQRIQAHPLHWRDIVGTTDAQVADMVREDGIDILVDLAGHTGNNRMLLFARKPAPVQVSWIGYPNTTGLKAVDYRIVDGYTDPPGMTDPFYTETLIRLPESFLCYQPEKESPEIGPLPALQNGHITFGSFNIISKVSPETISIWSQVLQGVPGSKLLLKAKGLFDADTRRNIASLFAQEGIPEERLVFTHHTASHKEHLAMYRSVDIGLDPFPYNGTTTTCEALWMGVPVITLAGDRHASRVGMSLLTNIGLPGLVAQTRDEYVKTASALARDMERLQSLRKRLRDMMAQSPLMNADRFTRNLEHLLRKMWQKYCEEQGSRS